MSGDEDEEYDMFGKELSVIQAEMTKTGFPLGQVSGWDDDAEGVEEDRNPFQSNQKEILWAAENGELSVVRKLLMADPELINVKDKDGYTPLHRACYNDHEEIVDFLLSQGADIAARTEDGWQPLHSACKWNNVRCVAKLLEHGADVNATSKGASNSYAKDTLQMLLLHPDIQSNLKNRSGELPIDLARRCGRYEYLFEIAEPCINIP
ncbi:ankyrin repeat domain-containing protein 49-like isoform X2 [Periplaneta americana]|uniref:ankyrin repeat domain-containing protein 49-like isoform X2 n=1 Tax=Periplaneta americana TaxID=6978 RepID=UPI0037E8951F